MLDYSTQKKYSMATPSNESIALRQNVDTLKDLAYSTSSEEVRRDFDEEQLIEFKDELWKLTRARLDRSEVKKALDSILTNGGSKDDLLSVLEPIVLEETGLTKLGKDINELTRKTAKGYEIVKETLYGFDYQEVNRMAFYDKDGQFVYDRPLKRVEKQTKITSLTARTGTND
jgi:phage terminase Nu1 subunit (DNA packaging protein)